MFFSTCEYIRVHLCCICECVYVKKGVGIRRIVPSPSVKYSEKSFGTSEDYTNESKIKVLEQ